MPSIARPPKIKIAIDRGGTFTDCLGISESKGNILVKLLSVDPANYPDAPTEGIRRILEWFTESTIPRGQLIDLSRCEFIRMGTTVATNALLERKGERHALLTTAGFQDVIVIGNQTRPKLFDLAIKRPDVLYDKVVEIDERAIVEWSELVEEGAEVSIDGHKLVKGTSGDVVRIIKPLGEHEISQSVPFKLTFKAFSDKAEVRTKLQALYDEGFRSLAIVFMHSFTFRDHEIETAEIAEEIGFEHISQSSDLQAMIRIVPRANSASADAYLTPEIRRYLSQFAKGFVGHLEDETCQVSFMQSDGSLVDHRHFSGLRAILSGPAGGVVGYAQTSYDAEEGTPVVGFDMGGTSTDVSRYGGKLEHVFETTTAGVTIQSPQLDISTVAAGGGSMLFYRNGLFVVGPDSAGAHPGPACYRKGGPLTVTDANLFLGRLHIDSFPKIFGKTENLPLDYDASAKLFIELTRTINAESGQSLTPEAVASGFIDVANETMARPIRGLTEARGYSTQDHSLSCFGGAGGQHASAIASTLNIHNVIVHKYSSVLSAYGMALADVAVDLSEPSSETFNEQALGRIVPKVNALKAKALSQLEHQGVLEDNIYYEVIKQIKEQATNSNVEIEISRQRGDGHHLFEFMGKKVWKKYLGIENVVVRLSNGTTEGKENAILLNSHLDSTLPSPGASDDAAGVAVMLESIRVLSQTADLQLNTALVFLFNGAEESLQDASHLFITQHEWRHTLRAAINLEACGTGGAEMLFQATSSAMLDIYSHSPRPFGSITAPEIFATGLILSDTDFRQFEQYGGLTGLDVALVKDSYKYHTRLDLVEYIEPGALQHFGDNIIAMLKAIGTSDPSKFIGIKKARDTLYFTALGGKILVMVKASTATIAYSALFMVSIALAFSRMEKSYISGYVVCLISVPLSMVSGIVTANIAALVMTKILVRPLSYFRKEWWCVPLYGAPAVLGVLLAQLLLAGFINRQRLFGGRDDLVEHALLIGHLLFFSAITLIGQLFGVLSSYICALGAASLLAMLVVNDFILARQSTSNSRPISTASYFIAQAIPIVTGAEGLATFLDVIVPLTGRTGVDAPSDHIIASLVSGISYLIVPAIPIAAHRFGTKILLQAVVFMLFASGAILSIFAAPGMQAFDFLHPKRVLCLYMEDTSSNTLSLHIAGLDPSPFEQLVDSLADKMELQERPVLSEIRDDIADWDIIYPVSQFLHSYKIPLPPPPSTYVSPFKDTFKVELLESRLNAVTRARSIKLAIHHPGIIWSVIAFDANVMRWNLPARPEHGMIRHHVKEASAYNVSTWELDMELQLDDVQFQAALRQSQRRKGQRKEDPIAAAEDDKIGGLRIEFSGLDVKRMWHHRSNENRENMEFVDRLDKVMPDWVDPMLLTAVSGVTIV